MRSVFISLPMLLFLISIAHVGDIEGADPPTDGTRIRVTVPGGNRSFDRRGTHATRRYEGTLLIKTDDELAIQLKGSPDDTVWVQTSKLLNIEVVDGTRSRPGRGALIGLGVGLAAGLTAAIIAAEVVDCYDCDLAYIFFPPLGAAGGLVIGTVMGSFSRTDHWIEVAPHQLNVGLVTRPGGQTGLALTIRF